MKDIERVYASIYAPDGQLLKSGELAHNLLLRENGIVHAVFKDNQEHYITHISNVVVSYTER